MWVHSGISNRQLPSLQTATLSCLQDHACNTRLPSPSFSLQHPVSYWHLLSFSILTANQPACQRPKRILSERTSLPILLGGILISAFLSTPIAVPYSPALQPARTSSLQNSSISRRVSQVPQAPGCILPDGGTLIDYCNFLVCRPAPPESSTYLSEKGIHPTASPLSTMPTCQPLLTHAPLTQPSPPAQFSRASSAPHSPAYSTQITEPSPKPEQSR